MANSFGLGCLDHGAGFVDDEAEGAALGVFAHVHDAAGKRLVHQTRHGDQEMMRQVDGCRIRGHAKILR